MTDAKTAPSVSDRIQVHLAALPDGIGCRYLARERDGIDAGLLVRLGLVKPILRLVPRCAEHACPWQPRCAHWPAFEPEGSGPVAGIKYKPTPLGQLAAVDATRVASTLDDLPLATDLLVLLAAGPASIFTLHTHFLRRARLAARDGADPNLDGLDRPTLGGVLDLLVEIGRIERSKDGVSFHLIQASAASTTGSIAASASARR